MTRLTSNLSTLDQAWNWDKIRAHDCERPVDEAALELRDRMRGSKVRKWVVDDLAVDKFQAGV